MKSFKIGAANVRPASPLGAGWQLGRTRCAPPFLPAHVADLWRMKPPTANELVGPPPHGLDEKWALKNFFGKTQEQAVEMCKSSAVTEDFTYMASAGLCYYLPAALRYLESDEAAHHWEFAHGLLCALSSQVSIFGMRGEPVVLIKQIADYCDLHREKFGLGAGDLLDEYLEKIRSA